jgi:hypothetical protein
MNKTTLKAKITKALRKGIGINKLEASALIPEAFTAGKLYEAYVLGILCQRLALSEGWQFTLIGSKTIALKSSPGPINAAYPHIEVTYKGAHIANIWTDIEFTSMSGQQSMKGVLAYGDFHELDIAVVSPTSSSRPLPADIFLAVECKNTGYQKSLLREILGVRRELSLLHQDKPTMFSSWPRALVPANPPSCIAVYSTDPTVLKYASPGKMFGIDFFYEPM